MAWIVFFFLAMAFPVASGLGLWSGSHQTVQFGVTVAQISLLGMLTIAMLIHRG